MTAPEILEKVNAGETVVIAAKHLAPLHREIVRLGLVADFHVRGTAYPRPLVALSRERLAEFPEKW